MSNITMLTPNEAKPIYAEKFRALATELKNLSPDWEYTSKKLGYVTSFTDSYITRTFNYNGHERGWISVYLSNTNTWDNNSNCLVKKVFVRLESSQRGSREHKRNWGFKTKDLADLIEEKAKQLKATIEKRIEEEREEARQTNEMTDYTKNLLLPLIPDWHFDQGTSYRTNGFIPLPNNLTVSTRSFKKDNDFNNPEGTSVDFSRNLTPKEIEAVVNALKVLK